MRPVRCSDSCCLPLQFLILERCVCASRCLNLTLTLTLTLSRWGLKISSHPVHELGRYMLHPTTCNKRALWETEISDDRHTLPHWCTLWIGASTRTGLRFMPAPILGHPWSNTTTVNLTILTQTNLICAASYMALNEYSIERPHVRGGEAVDTTDLCDALRSEVAHDLPDQGDSNHP